MAKEKFDNEDQELELSEDFDEDESEDEGDEDGLEEIEVYTLEDEDGNESEFTLIKRMTIEGSDYVAFEYFNENEDEENEIGEDEDSFVILKVVDEGGEEIFITIEDDEEFDKVADIFEDALMEELAGEDEDDEE